MDISGLYAPQIAKQTRFTEEFQRPVCEPANLMRANRNAGLFISLLNLHTYNKLHCSMNLIKMKHCSSSSRRQSNLNFLAEKFVFFFSQLAIRMVMNSNKCAIRGGGECWNWNGCGEGRGRLYPGSNTNMF